MKSVLTLIAFGLSMQFVIAQNYTKAKTTPEETAPKIATGITFFQGTWAELLAEAKSKSKPFFVDTYTEWCGPCKAMSKLTFTDEEVGKVTDQYFIAYKVDAEKGEGITIAEKYKVNAYPTVLFFNTDGKQIGKEKGMMDVEKFLYVLEKYLKKASK
jgi:thiol:disulfide interchange protein